MPPSAVYSPIADSSRWCIHAHKAYQADVSMDFYPRLEQPSKVKFYARVSSRVSFLYLKYKQPNLAFLSGRLTSSSDLASYAPARSSSVQRSFFCGDVIRHGYGKPFVSKLSIRKLCCVRLQNRLDCAQNRLDCDKNRLEI